MESDERNSSDDHFNEVTVSNQLLEKNKIV